ncbi:hypothetical protein AAC387_Pa11g0945 [Persea americana]
MSHECFESLLKAIKKLHAAHTYILFNCEEIDDFVKSYDDELKANQSSITDKNIQLSRDQNFALWLKDKLKEDSEKRKLVKTEVVSETRKSSSLGEKELSPKLKNKAQNAEAKQAIKAMATPKVPTNDSNAKLHCAISFCSDNSRGLKQGKAQNIIERKKSFMSERPVSPMVGFDRT